jgi:hypothetical protein
MRLSRGGVLNAPLKTFCLQGDYRSSTITKHGRVPTVAAPTGVMGGGGTVSGDAGFCGGEVVALPGQIFETGLALRGAGTAGPEAGDRL